MWAVYVDAVRTHLPQARVVFDRFHGVGFGHRAEDPPPAPAAIAHQHLKAEHPLE